MNPIGIGRATRARKKEREREREKMSKYKYCEKRPTDETAGCCEQSGDLLHEVGGDDGRYWCKIYDCQKSAEWDRFDGLIILMDGPLIIAFTPPSVQWRKMRFLRSDWGAFRLCQ